ncbi:hypothetical protein [Streptomyces sp. NPDC050504]|uniref:hypothetical protein n=1 Tax=Streptomyces sp. NPDC050504 TaxID=3365618 RepID=UPI0037B59AC2
MTETPAYDRLVDLLAGSPEVRRGEAAQLVDAVVREAAAVVVPPLPPLADGTPAGLDPRAAAVLAYARAAGGPVRTRAVHRHLLDGGDRTAQPWQVRRALHVLTALGLLVEHRRPADRFYTPTAKGGSR